MCHPHGHKSNSRTWSYLEERWWWWWWWRSLMRGHIFYVASISRFTCLFVFVFVYVSGFTIFNAENLLDYCSYHPGKSLRWPRMLFRERTDYFG